MTCEEFQIAALELDAAGQDAALQQEAREHLRECPRCVGFQRSWHGLRAELWELGAKDRTEQAPPRVEMRLRQEFRTKHTTLMRRRNAVISAWGLAAVAVLVVALGWISWRHEKNAFVAKSNPPAQTENSPVGGGAHQVTPAGPELGEVLVASNDAGEFTLLPESMPGFLEDATVVHVQMQRGALGALGLTVNEEHAGDWIQVDLLVGDDGQPQAVRLAKTAN